MKINDYDIRELEIDDRQQLISLIHKIENNLIREEFWLPITELSRKNFFNKDWTYFLGMYDKEKLIAAFGLFFNENEFQSNAKAINISNEKCAELGRAMVDQDYRSQGLMFILGKKLIDYANKNQIMNLVATAHPDNIASQKTLVKLGFQKVGYIEKGENGRYVRDIFLKSIDS